jgi:hypothetical protein
MSVVESSILERSWDIGVGKNVNMQVIGIVQYRSERKSTSAIYKNPKAFLRRFKYATRVLILLETNFSNSSQSPNTNK